MLWQELIKIALMGTERTQISDSVKDQLRAFGIQPDATAPQTVLEGASYLALMHKSGVQAREWTGDLPPAAPEEKVDNICSPAAIRCLQKILDNTYPLALNEFIDLLKKNKRHLPAELLPELFEQSRQSPELWKKLQHCIGSRGQWLLAQNPDWQILLQVPTIENWETGTRAQRKAILEYLRGLRPEEALELLQSTWSTEDTKSRIAFIPILEIGLSAQDGPFLENCRYDRRKEVRQKAATLLAQIPDSALVERMYQNTIALFTQKKRLKKIKLDVQLPEELTDEMIRDGIDAHNKWYQGGMKAGHLGQMIARIPPARWEKHFDREAEEVLDIFIKSNWPELFFQALSFSAARCHDEKWMEVLLNFWLKNHHLSDWQNIDLQAMLSNIPATLFNKIALWGLESDASLLESTAPIGIMLKEVEQPWEDQVTILFFRHVKAWLQNNPGQYWSSWHFWNILQKAAYLVNPQLCQTLQKAFDNNPIWYQAGEEIDKFMRILKFRYGMIKSLANTPQIP